MARYEERLDADVKALKQKVAQQGARVVVAMDRAAQAVLSLNQQLAADTILGDHVTNRRAQEIDRLCHAFVARHVPSAGHLRFVSAVLRVNIALERIGDYATTICREVAQMHQVPPESIARDIELIAQSSRRILEQAGEAFIAGSVDQARSTIAFASQRSGMFHRIFKDLLREGEQGTRAIEDLFSLLVVLYRLERVANQAKNICEETIFTVTGETKQPKVYSVLFVDRTNDKWSKMAVAIARKAFPESGHYESAGWEPAAELDPAVGAYLDERGFEVRRARTTKLATEHDVLAEHHVLVGLEPGLRERVTDPPFHTVITEWDDLFAEGEPATDDASLEKAQKALAARIQDLMSTLRGEGAA